MKKLISCLIVVSSLASFASPTIWELSELLARRDLEIYATLEKTETDPTRKEAFQVQIEKAKSRIEASIAAGRRAKDEEDTLRRNHTFDAFGFSAVASVAGVLVKFVAGPSFPVAGPPIVAPATFGLVATLLKTALEIIRRDSFEGIDTVFKAGIMGAAIGVFPTMACGRF